MTTQNEAKTYAQAGIGLGTVMAELGDVRGTQPGDESWAASPGVRRSMQSNTRTDTNPEVRLRSALHRAGLRFRKDHPIRVASGRQIKVDIAFPASRLAVFVDGCFWHRCPKHATDPRTNVAFWREKFDRNVMRDRTSNRALALAGWRVLRIWEHEPVERAAAMVWEALDDARRV